MAARKWSKRVTTMNALAHALPMSPKLEAVPLPEDTVLAKRAKAGDLEAFRAIVEQFSGRVFRLVRSYVRGQDEAEDVVQEVFYKVHTKLGSWREDSAFFTWLYRVAINTAHDYRKRRHYGREAELDEPAAQGVADDRDEPAESLRRRDLKDQVRQAIGRLPEKFSAVLILREIDGLAYDEIARVLNVAIGTVESRLFRARERLRVELETAGLLDP